MARAVFDNVRIHSLAGAVPKKVINNREYDKIFGKDVVDRFINLTGVEMIHKAERLQTSGDLGFTAAEKLLSHFRIDRKEIGVLIYVTESPDYIWPSTAYVIHGRLNLSTSCMAFDVNLGCSGFVYGLHLCSSLLQNIQHKYALLITGEADKFEDFLSRENPDTANVMMFGDASTACLLERTEKSDYGIQTELYGDGSGYRMMIRGGMCRSIDENSAPMRCEDGIDRSILDPYMDGMSVFQFSTNEVPKAVKKFLNDRNETLSEYEKVYFHQANKMIVERIAKKLKLNKEKVPFTIEKYGNTSSATIPITMIDVMGESDNHIPQKVLMCGFGVGLSWGCVSTYIEPDRVLPVIETDDYYADGEIHLQ